MAAAGSRSTRAGAGSDTTSGPALGAASRASLARRDYALLALLLPVAFAAGALHVRQVIQTGLAQPPVFAAPGSADTRGDPVVGGERVESARVAVDLRPGDVLRRVGGESLTGVGYVGFDALVLEYAGPRAREPVEIAFERAGERRTTSIRPQPRPLPWSRIPIIVMMVLVSTLVLLRAPGRRGARLIFVSFVAFSIHQSSFDGGPRWQTWISASLWNGLAPVVVVLLLEWARRFPDEVPDEDRPWVGLPYLAGASQLLVRVNYLTGWPLPPQAVPRLSFASYAGFYALALGLIAWNYRHATPVGRRRARWVLYGGAAGASMIVAANLLPRALPGGPDLFPLALALAFVATAAGPLGVLTAVVRFNAYDVDRLISATASYTLALAALAGAAALILSGLSQPLSSWLGTGPATVEAALALLAVGVAVPAARRVRPRFERIFYPERAALAAGTERLLDDLSDCHTPDEVADLLRDRLVALLSPRRCDVLLGADPPAPLSPEVELTVPLGREAAEGGFIALGAKRSGDVYTSTDRARLARVAQRATAELQRIRDAGIIARERAHAQELERLRADAQEATRAKSRHLAAASHDLRQPLHALGFLVDGLRRELPGGDAPLAADVERLARASQRLGDTIHGLLESSKLDAGAVTPERASFELDALVERACAHHAEAAAERGCELVQRASGLAVHSDPALVARMLDHWLSNAIRFAGGGPIEVGAEPHGAELLLSVRDSGPGLPSGELAQEFARGADSPGAGLGLSIVEKLARLLGHPLELQSEPGRGALFGVWLPRAETPTRASAPGLAHAPASLTGRLVLVVDDDLAILAALCDALESWGCEAILASSGDEALETLDTRARRGAPAPDAVLADWRLAGEERGPEVIARVRARLPSDPPLPAAIVSGEAHGEWTSELRRSGLPVLQKPLAPARLRALLSDLLHPRPAPSA